MQVGRYLAGLKPAHMQAVSQLEHISGGHLTAERKMA
jgi:hypothetical protein